MPIRPFSRESQWLLPPRVDELIGEDHAARFVAAFIDELDEATWRGLAVVRGGEKEGAPAYHAALLLSVWLYGFMTKVRSSRRLEAACREQLPYIWLSANQRPDHNTLWRFYRDHRQAMRKLLKLTVKTAVAAGLLDLAVQAVDGTRIAGNASPDKTFNQEGLEKLLQRVDAAIEDLEAQNATGGDKPASHLPKELQAAKALQTKVKEALEKIQKEDEHRSYLNLSDSDAALLRTRGGYVIGYNAQAMAAALNQDDGKSTGHFVTAAEVVNELDVHQLIPLMEEAEENAGEPAAVTLADAGYHSGANLVACEAQSRTVVMPESQAKALRNPYHKDAFVHDRETDTYICPQGQKLRFAGTMRRNGKIARRYLPESASVCRACPAFGVCTTNKRHGRSLSINPEEEALRRHRAWIQTEEAKALYSKRKQLIEPVFGIIKEHLMGTRRFLLRGMENVAAEWSLLATAFNLRVLARIWQKARRLDATSFRLPRPSIPLAIRPPLSMTCQLACFQ